MTYVDPLKLAGKTSMAFVLKIEVEVQADATELKERPARIPKPAVLLRAADRV